jgi:predicted ester cyclase
VTARNLQDADGIAVGRAAYAALMERVAVSDLLTALREAATPDAVAHVQNGEAGSAEMFLRHASTAISAFSDLEMEVESTIFLPYRYVAQVRVRGLTAPGNQILPSGSETTSVSCWIARVDESLRTVEFWSYLNPGFFFSFPPAGHRLQPPRPTGAGIEEARALVESWVRRLGAGAGLLDAVAATVAPHGVVHLGNGDVGPASILLDLQARIRIGLPDLTANIESVFVTEDRVIVQFRMSGTHAGMIGVHAATGRQLPSTGALVARADHGGQAAEVWLYIAPVYSLLLPPGS